MIREMRISTARALATLVLGLLLALPLRGLACTEDRVLEFIGELEAPGGYDTVYYGVRLDPPRPVTGMSVAEVLAWQDETVRAGSASTAAGRYQIIRRTLRGLVEEGVVSPSERFDAATQDRLGRHLLRETGYRPGDASPVAGDRIARVWAALPRLSGAQAGQSVYHGIADNHALVPAPAWQGLLNCSLSVSEALEGAAVIRAGQRFGFSWDRFLDTFMDRLRGLLDAVARSGVALLFLLFTFDLIWRAGRGAFRGGSPTTLVGDIALRFGALAFCMTLLTWPGEAIDLIAGQARAAAEPVTGSSAFALADYTAGKTALLMSLFEGIMNWPMEIQFCLFALGALITCVVAAQVAVILYWHLNLFFTGVSGVLLAAFGALEQTAGISARYVRHLLGAGLSLLAALLVIAFADDLASEAGSMIDPIRAALVIALIEIVALIMIWMLPRGIGRLAKG